MINKFRVFDSNILFESNFPLKVSGFSSLFERDFVNADIVCHVFLSKQLNNATCVPVVTSSEFSVVQNGFDIIRTARDIPGGNELARAVMNRRKKTIELYVTENYADCFYYWPLLRFDSFLRDSGTLMFHASYIVTEDNKAIIFASPSGGGKSTQARLWTDYKKARTINGDKVVLKINDSKVFAYSLPICGTSGICLNETHEVKCIVILSHGSHNTLKELKDKDALEQLIKTSFIDYWDSSDLFKCLSIIKNIVQKTLVCTLSCLPNSSACDCLDAFLMKKSCGDNAK